jgi:hypothetical protein
MDSPVPHRPSRFAHAPSSSLSVDPSHLHQRPGSAFVELTQVEAPLREKLRNGLISRSGTRPTIGIHAFEKLACVVRFPISWHICCSHFWAENDEESHGDIFNPMAKYLKCLDLVHRVFVPCENDDFEKTGKSKFVDSNLRFLAGNGSYHESKP